MYYWGFSSFCHTSQQKFTISADEFSRQDVRETFPFLQNTEVVSCHPTESKVVVVRLALRCAHGSFQYTSYERTSALDVVTTEILFTYGSLYRYGMCWLFAWRLPSYLFSLLGRIFGKFPVWPPNCTFCCFRLINNYIRVLINDLRVKWSHIVNRARSTKTVEKRSLIHSKMPFVTLTLSELTHTLSRKVEGRRPPNLPRSGGGGVGGALFEFG